MLHIAAKELTMNIPKPAQNILDLATVAKEVNKGEAFVSVVNEDIYEYALLPALRAIRRQIFGGSCDSEDEEKRALEFWNSKQGEKIRAGLYDYTAMELMKKSADLSRK
jgi:hypothetical protein